MTLNKIVLLACGSFNPPTNMHLRMFEIAKDHLHRLGTYKVIGGLISPVHDSYGKAELVPAKDRITMLELALEDNDWIKLSDWETKQESWTRTRQSLSYHQNLVNEKTNGIIDKNLNEDSAHWITNNYRNQIHGSNHIQVKLLCGADLLESFGTPGLWANEDIEAIVGQHGLVVITRENTNPLKFIYNSDILTKYMANITIVTEWITNEVSSTKIRRALRRSESVKYLIPKSVIDYIHTKGLYGSCNNNKYLLAPEDSLSFLLTPSPTDMSIDTPSPMRCMNLCNNNLFVSSQASPTLLIDVPDCVSGRTSITTTNSSKGTTNHKHPGQAVKIITEVKGTHKIVKEVRTDSKRLSSLKNSKSCTELPQVVDSKTKQGNMSKSNDDLLEQKSCDENLIKFIFTQHGIQVISDVETIV